MKAFTLVAASALLAAAWATQASAAGCPRGFSCTYDSDVPGKIVSQTPTPTTHVVINNDTGHTTTVPNSPPGGPAPHE